MMKDDLKEKINKVFRWTLGLTILYFLVGAWFISDGPRFDPVKTYGLLKDTLTLTAAFLAPVAAFVLFSDWRKQHREKLKEELSEKVINNFDYAHSLCFMLKMSIDHEDSYLNNANKEKISEAFQEVSITLTEARNNLKRLKIRDIADNHDFISVAEGLLDNEFSMWKGTLIQIFALQNKHKGSLLHGCCDEYDQYDQDTDNLTKTVWSNIKILKDHQKSMVI